MNSLENIKTTSLRKTMIDVTLPPYHADPTGQKDSTLAICYALNDVTALTLGAFGKTLYEMSEMPFRDGFDDRGVENRKRNGAIVGIFPSVLPYVPVLYFPKGTYLISDTLTYRHKGLKNSGGSELCAQIRMKGEDRQQTVIQLKDQCEGFAESTPKPMVQFMQGDTSNVAMSNYFENMTLDSGTGNPGAAGLDFFANNSGAVRNVTIRSGDGSGSMGLILGHSNFSGVLVRDLEIQGFDTGLHVDSERGTMFMAGEKIVLKNQNREAVYAGSPSISLRDVTCENAPCAVNMATPHGHLVMVDSVLGGKGGAAMKTERGSAYFSNITTRGFTEFLSGHPQLPLTCKQLTLTEGTPDTPQEEDVMPRLEAEQPPRLRFTGENRCDVDTFGAIPDGSVDASPAIQAALDSGAEEVHFGAGKYLLDQPVTIPAYVNRLSFHFCDLITGPAMREMKGEGVFTVSGDSDTPLLFEDLFTWEQFCGECITLLHGSTRTLVIEDVHTQTLSLYRNTVPGGKVFLENVACTTGVVPGTEDHGKICMHFTGQQVWARQLNPERGHPMVVNDGGTLWVLGFKTEDDATGYLTLNGGKTELLGGILNFGGDNHPAFHCKDSEMRVSATSNTWEGSAFKTVVSDQRGEAHVKIESADLPRRHYPAPRDRLYNLALYASESLPDSRQR